MEQYYINQIVTRNIHLNLVNLIKEIKNSIETNKEFKIQGVSLSSKSEKYYKLLKKILKFLDKIIKEHGLDEKMLKEVVLDLWILFFESQNNQLKESNQINKFVKNFFENDIQKLDTNIIESFLTESISKMENCLWIEFFEVFKTLIIFVNERNGNIEIDEIMLDGGYFNDYSTKKLKFYVLKVPSEELNFFNELESLFLSTRNSFLESFLCRFICSLISKPTYASSDFNNIYKQEENKLTQRALKILNEENTDGFDFNYKNVPQKLVNKIKFTQLLNRCMGLAEPFGLGDLVSFASLREGIPLLLNFEKENTYSSKTTSKFFFFNW